MLTMKDARAHKKDVKSEPAPNTQKPLMMHNTQRGRVASVPPRQSKPNKILTLHDLPRKDAAVKKFVTYASNIERDHDNPNTPGIFANRIPEGLWAGRRCFIIGGGPSVSKINMNRLAGELVIGINRAYEIIDPSILYGVDGQLFGWATLGQLGEESKRKFAAYEGYKVWMALHKVFPPDFDLVEVDTAAGHKIGTLRKFAFKNNSGYGALQLAAIMGCKEIYLLGFDMRGDRKGQQKWWHDGYPVDYGENIYNKYITALNELAPVLVDAGVRVVNLNPKSRLKCFPFGNLKNTLATKPKRPLVVSYYTKNTGYEAEAKRLMKELHLFGLEYDIQAIETFGSWQENTHYKAEFILGMMDKHPERNLLWLDADSSLQQYPDFFDDADFDLGVHKIDWVKYTGGVRRDMQLANAVIYLKNNLEVRAFMRAWVCYNNAHKDEIEMQTMAKVLAKFEDKLKYTNIPASYCQIWDTMAGEGKPVIEQRQASRLYRYAVGKDDPIANTEKQKYDHCWTTKYSRSQCAEPLVKHVRMSMKRGDRVLDIGCGDCTTVIGLRKAGVNCTGVDISLKGSPNAMYGVFEAPVWNMPFEDNAFDYTVSTDVLEHVPTEKVPDAIREIYRVTKRKTFHVIALFDGILNGVTLHMTVKPIEWWIDQFDAVDKRGLDVKVISRGLFMGGK